MLELIAKEAQRVNQMLDHPNSLQQRSPQSASQIPVKGRWVVTCSIGGRKSYPVLCCIACHLIRDWWIRPIRLITILFTLHSSISGFALTEAEAFKRFTQTPPAFVEALLSVQSPFSTSSYHIKWQTNCLWVATFKPGRPVAQNAAVSDYRSIVARQGNFYAHWVGNAFYVWTNRNLPTELSNSVLAAYNNTYSEPVAELLTLGCSMAKPHTLTWSNDTCFSTGAHDNLSLRGVLTVDPAGRPTQMTLFDAGVKRYLRGARFEPWTHTYRYDPTGTDVSLPIAVTRSFFMNNGERFVITAAITWLQCSDLVHPQSEFALDPNAFRGLIGITTVSNGYLVLRSTNGVISRFVDAPEPKPRGVPQLRWLFALVFVLTVVLPLAFAARWRRQKVEA